MTSLDIGEEGDVYLDGAKDGAGKEGYDILMQKVWRLVMGSLGREYVELSKIPRGVEASGSEFPGSH